VELVGLVVQRDARARPRLAAVTVVERVRGAEDDIVAHVGVLRGIDVDADVPDRIQRVVLDDDVSGPVERVDAFAPSLAHEAAGDSDVARAAYGDAVRERRLTVELAALPEALDVAILDLDLVRLVGLDAEIIGAVRMDIVDAAVRRLEEAYAESARIPEHEIPNLDVTAGDLQQTEVLARLRRFLVAVEDRTVGGYAMRDLAARDLVRADHDGLVGAAGPRDGQHVGKHEAVACAKENRVAVRQRAHCTGGGTEGLARAEAVVAVAARSAHVIGRGIRPAQRQCGERRRKENGSLVHKFPCLLLPSFQGNAAQATRSSRDATPRRSRRGKGFARRSEEHTSELQSRENLVCRLLLE